MEFLIPLLFFAIPVAAALLDKHAKAQKEAPHPRKAVRPVAFPSPARPQASRPPTRESTMTQPVETPVPADPELQEQEEEGVRMINREPRPDGESPTQARKLEIDKKKLILYSEILKPKFDQ